MALFPLLLTLASVPSWAASSCTQPPASFESIRVDLLNTVDAMVNHINATKCLVASCDPTHGTDGQCFTSSHDQVINAQNRFAAKIQKIQQNRAGVKSALDKYSAQMKALGGDSIPAVDSSFACKGAGQAGVQAMDDRKKPILDFATTWRQLKAREYLRDELASMNRTFDHDLAQTRPRPYPLGPITVNLPCDPNLAAEFIRTRDSLQAAYNHATDLEAYLSSQACRLDDAKTTFTNLQANCGSTNGAASTVTGATSPAAKPLAGSSASAAAKPSSAAVSGDAKPRTAATTLSAPAAPAAKPSAVPHIDFPSLSATPAVAATEKPAALDPSLELAPLPPDDSVPLPRPKPSALTDAISVDGGPKPASIQDPDKWGTLTAEQWKKNDDYKASIAAAEPRLYSTDSNLSNFLSQARSSDRSDYALRVQAAINATAMEENGETSGPAPSVFQDGIIGSRTRGALNYYLSDPSQKETFLRNLAAYGITIQ